MFLTILDLEGAQILIAQNTISVRVCRPGNICFPFKFHSYQLYCDKKGHNTLVSYSVQSFMQTGSVIKPAKNPCSCLSIVPPVVLPSLPVYKATHLIVRRRINSLRRVESRKLMYSAQSVHPLLHARMRHQCWVWGQ
jgi:hypothetical protein